jgi:GT2 family glycosyltransferase
MAMSETKAPERGTLMDNFHRARANGEHGNAVIFLEKALQTPEYRPEALIWKGIEAIQQQRPHHAFLFLSSAAHALPDRADIRALTGRSILAQQQPKLAAQQLGAAWQQMPADPSLRIMLWQARSRTETPAKLRKQIFARLPDIDDASELGLVLGFLAAQPDAPRVVGVVRFQPETDEVVGWAVNLKAPKCTVQMNIDSNDERTQSSADQPHPLLTKAGLTDACGAIRVRISNPAQTLHVRFDDGTPLAGSPLSNLPAFNPPTPASKNLSRQEPVDILVPVYDGYDETLECLHSVLRNRSLNRTAHRLVVLDDATPNPALREALKALAAAGEIEHVQHPVNLGFIRNVNRGMALSPERDVVWLNADTRVHGNWLDRLRSVAYSEKDIASVTPFTNNGELMSFPVSRVSQSMPTAEEQAVLDDMALLANSPPIEIETGCGFCLYIKRSAIDVVGYLDEVHLLRGYGEETDWCLRARGLGWRHMGAPGVFVAHQGGISFGDEKALRVAHNNAILKRRYPDASNRYQDFCLRDPLKPSRQALQRARLTQLPALIASSPSCAWPALGLKQLHLQTNAGVDAPLSLNWRHQGMRTLVTLNAQLQPLLLSLDYELPADSERLFKDLQTLPLDELIFQQLAGCPAELLDLPSMLDKPYRIICRDDELLRQSSSRDWPAFARHAHSVHLPWKALQKRYAAALPNARFTLDAKRKTLPASKPAPHILFISDTLQDLQLANKWLELGRRITRESLPVMLLVHGDNAWQKSLLATGAVHALPTVAGLTLADCLALAGCKGALSLQPNPGASWNAPELAASVGLPLYAMPGPVANEAGALSIHSLPLSPSRA